MGRLDGRVVIVTGSSTGIGEGIARSFAAEGASLVVNSVTSVELGRDVAASLPDAIYVRADVSDEVQAVGLVEAAKKRWGRLDVLINNAGVSTLCPHHDLDGVTDEMWRNMLDVNLLGPWYMIRAATPLLRQDGGGSVINITSLAGLRSTYRSAIPYAVSKAALNHMTFLLANVLGPEVRVNAIAPGFILSRMSQQDEALAAVVAAATALDTPLERVGDPSDMGDACLFLALSTYITGQVVACDGGKHIRVGAPSRD